jgi:hypothetical protein
MRDRTRSRTSGDDLMATAEQASSAADMEARYTQRMNRYVTAMRNEKPDMIPIRPFLPVHRMRAEYFPELGYPLDSSRPNG